MQYLFTWRVQKNAPSCKSQRPRVKSQVKRHNHNLLKAVLEIFPGGRNAGWQEAVSIFKLFALLMNSHCKMSIALYFKTCECNKNVVSLAQSLQKFVWNIYLFPSSDLCADFGWSTYSFHLKFAFTSAFIISCFLLSEKKEKKKKSYNFYETFCQNA